jgi:serine/threonine protein kinase HipA of HipAB toxin-antitoxin module
MSDDLPLQAKSEELEDALRHIGLHSNRSTWLDEGQQPQDPFMEEAPKAGRKILVMDLLIGDLAWSKKVQDPEQVDIDAEFKAMMRELNKTEDSSLRDEIKRKLADGKNLFDEDEAA